MFFHKNNDDEPSSGGDAPRIFPLLPLRDVIVFPHMVISLFVGREKSINALEEVMRTDKHILLVTQKNAGDENENAMRDLVYRQFAAGERRLRIAQNAEALKANKKGADHRRHDAAE